MPNNKYGSCNMRGKLNIKDSIIMLVSCHYAVLILQLIFLYHAHLYQCLQLIPQAFAKSILTGLFFCTFAAMHSWAWGIGESYSKLEIDWLETSGQYCTSWTTAERHLGSQVEVVSAFLRMPLQTQRALFFSSWITLRVMKCTEHQGILKEKSIFLSQRHARVFVQWLLKKKKVI